jgi:hypothetical protein
MQWCHPKRLLMSSAAGGRRQPASRHQSCNSDIKVVTRSQLRPQSQSLLTLTSGEVTSDKMP